MPPSVVAAIQAAFWMLPATLVLLALRHKGLLRRDALDHAPDRLTPLGPLDLAGVGVAWFAGALLFGAVLRALEQITGLPWHGPGATTTRTAALQVIATLTAYFPVMAYLGVRLGSKPGALRQFGLWPRNLRSDLGTAALALPAAMFLVIALNSLVVLVLMLLHHRPPAIGHELLKEIAASKSAWATLLMAIAAVVLAPVVEEIIFRGAMQTILLHAYSPPPQASRRWSKIAIASAVFTLVHAEVAAWDTMPALFLLSIILGYVYERTGSLLPSMLVHAGFNAINILAALFLPDAGPPPP